MKRRSSYLKSPLPPPRHHRRSSKPRSLKVVRSFAVAFLVVGLLSTVGFLFLVGKKTEAATYHPEWLMLENTHPFHVSRTVDIKTSVIGRHHGIRHTSLIQNAAWFSLSDAVEFPIDVERFLTLSERESSRLRFLCQRGELLSCQGGMHSTEVDGLRQLLEADNRRVFYANTTTHFLTPFSKVFVQWNHSFEEVKQQIAFRTNLYADRVDPSKYWAAITTLLVHTGVVVPSLTGEGNVTASLAAPILLHLSPIQLGSFAQMLQGHPVLNPSAVRVSLENWRSYLEDRSQKGTSDSPPPVPRRFVLVNAEVNMSPAGWMVSNTTFPPGVTPSAAVHAFLDHPLLVHWFATNGNVLTHVPKFTRLPIGLGFDRHNGDGLFGLLHGEESFLKQEAELLWSWFLPHESSTAAAAVRELGEGDFTMGGAHHHPADNLQALLERASGLRKWEGDSPSFEWQKRFTPPPQCGEDEGRAWCETGEAGEVVAIEMLDDVVEELRDGGMDELTWVRIDRVGTYVREKYGKSVVLKVRLVAPHLSLQPWESDVAKEDSEEGCQKVQKGELPMQCQLRHFGVVRRRVMAPHVEVEMMVPVAAVLALALQHYRPVASQEHRQLRVVSSFRDFGRENRKAIRKQLRLHRSLVWTLKSTQRRQFWNAVHMSLFVVSPPGQGYDCYRTWEALILGGIPIILHPSLFVTDSPYSSLTTNQSGVDVLHADSILELYEDLPVFVVKDFEREVTREQLEVWRAEVEEKRRRGVYRWEKLFSQHWLERVGRVLR